MLLSVPLNEPARSLRHDGELTVPYAVCQPTDIPGCRGHILIAVHNRRCDASFKTASHAGSVVANVLQPRVRMSVECTERSEHRRETRHPVSLRVRLWIFGVVGFVEGQATDASAHGLRMKLLPTLPTGLLHHGHRHSLDVISGTGRTMNVTAEIRHVTDRCVGLSIGGTSPLELLEGARIGSNVQRPRYRGH